MDVYHQVGTGEGTVIRRKRIGCLFCCSCSVENCRTDECFFLGVLDASLLVGTLCMDAEFYSGLHYDVHSTYGYTMSRVTDL